MAGKYNLIKEYSDNTDTTDVSSSPHWVIAVVRLAKPLSYSRQKKKSVTLDVTEGAKTRGKTLVISGDCISMNIQRAKESHVKALTAQLIQSDTNYLVEILPGDWMLAWIVHGKDKQEDLIRRIRRGDACNAFDDGLKFVGRVESIRKRASRDRNSGVKHARYNLRGYGFREFDTQIFYDHFLGENSVEAQDLGRWLAKVGLDIKDVFATENDHQKDNVHLVIPAFLSIFLGKGVSSSLNTVQDAEQLRQVTGGGIFTDDEGKIQEAPFSYLVPKEVGDLLGKKSQTPSKNGGILSYADCYELLFGVQAYEGGSPDEFNVFLPKIDSDSDLTKGNQKFTGTPLMGAYLPLMPDFDNRPLWSLLQQYLNPVINEMYTCLRVNNEGNVVPTMVLRQIPFTTNVLAEKLSSNSTAQSLAGEDAQVVSSSGFGSGIAVTKFMDLPRWVMPSVLVNDIDIGRSDAARCNFVHVYGQDGDNATNVLITDQLVNNPPVRDDFDIQRSGLHTFMSTIACRVVNEVGTTPSVWMEIIADHRIGAQYTLNGTLSCGGIQAPICEGDNLEFDGCVYHIESVDDQVSCEPNGGNRTWMTTLTVTNGLRAADSNSDTNADFPIYPGFKDDDNTGNDPAANADQPYVDNGPEQPKEAPPFDPNSDTGNA